MSRQYAVLGVLVSETLDTQTALVGGVLASQTSPATAYKILPYRWENPSLRAVRARRMIARAAQDGVRANRQMNLLIEPRRIGTAVYY